MTDERSSRRPNFLDGPRLRLSDGQLWTIPMAGTLLEGKQQEPGGDTAGPAWSRRDYEEALEAVCEAEDYAELLRAELALAICLLRRNYELTPEDFVTLLCFVDRDALTSMQREMGRIASAHLRTFRVPGTTRREGQGRREVFPSPIGALSS